MSNNNYSSNYSSESRPMPPSISAQPLPVDYVDAAEQVILKLSALGAQNVITNTKLRNLYSLITDISNVENLRAEEELLPKSQTQLMMARVRMVYEAGRDNNVKHFLQTAMLLEYLKDIGISREKLMQYSRYMEALVAYHRFHIGGRER